MSEETPRQSVLPVADGLNLAVVAARFNAEIVEGLLRGCHEALQLHGVAQGRVQVYRVPGTFEIAQAVRWLLAGPQPPHAVIALGAVIRGETLHYELLSAECVRSLSAIAVQAQVPVTMGVLTVEDMQQARARSTPGTPANRGYQAALAALEMAALRADLRART